MPKTLTPGQVGAAFLRTVGPTDPARNLRGAIRLVQRGWCQGEEAKDADGFGCSPTAPEAREWCALGALNGAARPGWPSYPLLRAVALAMTPAMPDFGQVRRILDGHGDPAAYEIACAWVAGFNDDEAHTAEDVILAFKRAGETLAATR